MLVICKNCGKEFEKSSTEVRKHPNHFCSRSCSATFNNKGKQRNPPKIRICKQCKSEYTYNRTLNTQTFCSDCFSKLGIEKGNGTNLISEQIKQLSIGDYRNRESVKDKHPSWLHSNIRNQCRSWNKGIDINGCQVCGYKVHTELCHIKPIASFENTAKLSEINHPDNILVLCPNHHWEFDNNIIKLEDIPKR